jgi:phosphoribosyl 1,2-cyclic phosphate phosphodiesterase|tara:strand:+ start:1951 stop:2724 length:774 start_codon:yes stop_codon:yes gene_type:complete
MQLKFTILGCGSSLGVPRADGNFGNCNPNDKKNYRTRCSAIITSKFGNTLIDTSPDLRFQLLKNKIKNVDRVLYSHFHADQTHGINDLRIFYLKNKKKIQVFADRTTGKYLINNFKYFFKNMSSYPAILELNILKKNNVFIDKELKLKIKTVKVKHGDIKCCAFIINNKCAYISDVSKIYTKDLKYFKNLNYFIVDCLRYNKHPSHYCLEDVLELIKILKPQKTVLTNLHSDLDYKKLKEILPKNILPAYDGMSFVL